MAFIHRIVCGAIAVIGLNCWAAGKYSILQGTTNETTTHFTVLAPTSTELFFEVVDLNKKATPPARMETFSVQGSDWSVRRLKFDSLDVRQEYLLLVKNASGQLEETRSFRMLDTKARSGKITAASCLFRHLYSSQLWDNFAQEDVRPDLFLFLGDTAYLDRPTLTTERPPSTELEAWDEFVQTRNTIGFYFWDHLVPVFSIWDDHDSGGNNVTARTFPLMAKIHRMHDALFANEPIPGFIERGPGLSLNFKLYGQNFIMLDGRSFRDTSSESPLFGEAQTRWLLDRVQSGPNILVNGTQFFGKYLKKDSFEFNHPEPFRKFVTRLREVGNQKNAFFNFLSGDVHFSELLLIESQQLGYPAYEISSSPAHSATFPGRYIWVKNPRRIDAVATFNMVNLKINHNPGQFDAQVTSIGWRGNVLFDHHLVNDGKRIYEANRSGPQHKRSYEASRLRPYFSGRTAHL